MIGRVARRKARESAVNMTATSHRTEREREREGREGKDQEVEEKTRRQACYKTG